jgi:hypothetical protein
MPGLPAVGIQIDFLATRKHSLQAFKLGLDSGSVSDQVQLRGRQDVGPLASREVADVVAQQIMESA